MYRQIKLQSVFIVAALFVTAGCPALSAQVEPTGDSCKALEQSVPGVASDLTWWVEAGKAQRQRKAPPY